MGFEDECSEMLCIPLAKWNKKVKSGKSKKETWNPEEFWLIKEMIRKFPEATHTQPPLKYVKVNAQDDVGDEKAAFWQGQVK